MCSFPIPPSPIRWRPRFKKTSWFSSSGWGYVELQPGADARAVMAKLPALIDRNVDPRKTMGISTRGSEAMHLHLTPFRDDHLSTDSRQSLTPAGSWATVYGSMGIGVLILLIACFNFTNLATARAMVRAREISLRKVVGARRGQLMVQFLGESILMALLSLILAVALVKALLPLYDSVLGKPIALHLLNEWPLLLALIGVAVLVGLLGGLYPALVLSRFRPAATLRTNTSGQSGSSLLRSLLVTMQFAVSIGLGIAALVVFAQISYARNIDLGLKKEGIVVVVAQGLAPSALQSLVHAFNADPALKGATLSGDTPFTGNASEDIIEIPGKPGTSMIRQLGTGPGFFSVYDIRLLSGRPLSESRGQDMWRDDAKEANVVINRAAAEQFGYSPQSALGKTFYEDNPQSKSQKGASHHRRRDDRFHVRGRPQGDCRRPSTPTIPLQFHDLGARAAGRHATGAFRDRPHLAQLRAFACHQPPFSGQTFSNGNSLPTNSRAVFSASSWASLFSLRLWVCSGWLLSRPSGAPRRSACAKLLARTPGTSC